MTGDDRDVADVCLIVEGAYPYVVGGVANWLQDLILGLPDLRFAVVAIKPTAAPTAWRIEPPANVIGIAEISLSPATGGAIRRGNDAGVARIASLLLRFVDPGGHASFGDLIAALSSERRRWTAEELLAHPAMFRAIADYAARAMPAASFHHLFWALRTLLGGLLAAILAPLPPARVYHSISTGFAGLIAARAAIDTGRPSMITEHGIYLLERQIEVMMADWIGDQIDGGLVLDPPHEDLRDVWRRTFENYTRVAYDHCAPIIALYAANNDVQARLGADRARLLAVPNGIDLDRFDTLADARDAERPLVALIGRVVPIKDVKTFIRAAAIVHAQMPSARFVVLGPTDEDAEYFAECRDLVTALDIGRALHFAGRVRVDEWLPRIAVVVLTSLSEAQPLVILEAGACGIPIIAPDVGSCRELIEGGSVHDRPGGIVTPLVDAEATAEAIASLLADDDRRRTMGADLRDRVRRNHDCQTILARYRQLYAEA